MNAVPNTPRIDEAAYARLLRRSARLTMVRMHQLGFVPRGDAPRPGLMDDIRRALETGPKTGAEVAAGIGKNQMEIQSSLQRLIARGEIETCGSRRNEGGRVAAVFILSDPDHA